MTEIVASLNIVPKTSGLATDLQNEIRRDLNLRQQMRRPPYSITRTGKTLQPLRHQFRYPPDAPFSLESSEGRVIILYRNRTQCNIVILLLLLLPDSRQGMTDNF